MENKGFISDARVPVPAGVKLYSYCKTLRIKPIKNCSKVFIDTCCKYIRYFVKFGASSFSPPGSVWMFYLMKYCPDSNSHIITEATCRQANDFRTGGSGAAQLSFPIAGLHIDFPAVNHPEVASHTNHLARLFLTDYCKALSRADFNKDDFHLKMNDSGLRARSGFNSTPSVLVKKNRASFSDENKYPAYIQHRELAFSQPLNHLC